MLCRCAVCVELWYREEAHFSECDSWQHVWHLTWLVLIVNPRPHPVFSWVGTFPCVCGDMGTNSSKTHFGVDHAANCSIVPGPLENETKCFRTLKRSKPGGSLWLIKIWHVYIYFDSDWSSGGVCGKSLPQESFFLLSFLWFLSKYIYPWFPWQFEGGNIGHDSHTLAFV